MKEQVELSKIVKCVGRVLFNQFVVHLPLSYAVIHPLMKHSGISYSPALPSL